MPGDIGVPCDSLLFASIKYKQAYSQFLTIFGFRDDIYVNVIYLMAARDEDGEMEIKMMRNIKPTIYLFVPFIPRTFFHAFRLLYSLIPSPTHFAIVFVILLF